VCGIGGILSKGTRDVPPGALVAMSEALQHRGPDDQGIYLSSNHKLGLVHRRLSIIDLSVSARQPMTGGDNRLRLVLNGEIYNYKTLRNRLIQGGISLRTHSDTEVILALYAQKKERLLEELRGMFAFALWDEPNETLFIARDRLGIKPLYTAETEDFFLFSSEVRAILATGLMPKILSRAGFEGYLALGSMPSPETMFEGIHLFPPAHFISIRKGKLQGGDYWKLSFNEETGFNLTETLQDAVKSHLVSDVPVGLFLSGGIDSTAIAALMRKNYPEKIQSFSIVFPGTTLDEGAFAQLAADTFQLEHHELSLSAKDLMQELPQIIAAMDEPSIDGINTYFVSKLAREHRTKVVLSGLGGDELFWGYPSYRLMPKLARLYSALRWIPGGRQLAVAALGRSKDPKMESMQDFFRHGGSPEAAYFSIRRLFLNDERKALLKNPPVDSFSPLHYLHQLSANGTHPLHPSETAALLEFRGYMHNQLLRDTDCMAMAHGVEVRVPFLDHPLVEAVNAIPAKQKLTRQPKALLLQATAALIPKAIYDRPKMGFTFPFETWMKSSLSHHFNQFFSDEPFLAARKLIDWRRAQYIWKSFQQGQIHWSRPWSLYVLNQWMEQYFE